MKAKQLIKKLEEASAFSEFEKDVVIDGTIGIVDIDLESDARFINLISSLGE